MLRFWISLAPMCATAATTADRIGAHVRSACPRRCGARHGAWSQLMQPVVKNLTLDDAKMAKSAGNIIRTSERERRKRAIDVSTPHGPAQNDRHAAPGVI